MKTAVIVINKDGRIIAERLKKGLSDIVIINTKSAANKKKSLSKIVEHTFDNYRKIIFCAAMGIVARLISALVKNKYSDPAVVCVDTAGRYAVSVLSGHEGGANQLAYSAAAAIDAEPVITTGTEVHKRFIIGIGCRKGVSRLKIKKAIDFVLKANKIKRTQVRLVATAALKKGEEGLIQACLDLQLPLVFISTEQIKRFKADISVSEIVKRHIGVQGVCEPCALIAGRRTKLLWPKQIIDSVTAALAMEN